MFEYCEKNGYEKTQFNEYLKNYTVYNAIMDIHQGWQNVPETTIQKSFRKVFPQDKFERITGYESTNEANFDGFENSDGQPDIDPATTRIHVMAKENVPGGLQIPRTQIVNRHFDQVI